MTTRKNVSCKTPHNYSCLARGNRRGRKEFILSTFVNELTDMPVTISYDPASELLRVETCDRGLPRGRRQRLFHYRTGATQPSPDLPRQDEAPDQVEMPGSRSFARSHPNQNKFSSL